MELQFRHIQDEEGLKQVYSRIRDLSKFEGIEHGLMLTNDRLLMDIRRNSWFCLASLLNEKIIGFIIYSYSNINRAFYPTEKMIHIDHFYVVPEYRGRGVGRGVLNALKEEGLLNACSRIELRCMKTNTHARTFYEENGFEELDFFHVLRFPLSKA